ncbi:MAG: peptide chain release factor N(5)-glutamine methyltransferase [Candidatus Melainabacteria bacterium]|nr:peptide chain release factor N(5)-glutamine methyltransferase [Candidatus Melainabacteria bacterium]
MTPYLLPEQNKLADIYRKLKQSLAIAEPEREAQIILERVTGLSASDLIAKTDQTLTTKQISEIYSIRDRRNQERIPLAYILEEAHWRDLKLFVNQDVLIPRPETELLVDIVLEEIKQRDTHQPRILDLCTGSGCIAIALKRALPAASIYASDISRAALNVAAINAKRYEVDIDFVMGDYLDPFLGQSQSPVAIPVMKGKPPYFDLIVSNPPYVSEPDYQELEPELHHEPKHALVGFPYKQIKQQVIEAKLIEEGGFMAFEFGQGQRPELEAIFPQAKFHKDLENNDRILVWTYQPELILGFKEL